MKKLHKNLGSWNLVVLMVSSIGLMLYGIVATCTGFRFFWMPSAAVMYILAACACLFTAMFVDRKKTTAVSVAFLELSVFAMLVLCFGASDQSEIKLEGLMYCLLLLYCIGGFVIFLTCAFGDDASEKENWGFVDILLFSCSIAGVAYFSVSLNMLAATLASAFASIFVFVSMIVESSKAHREKEYKIDNKISFNPTRPLSPANPTFLTAILGAVASLAISLPALFCETAGVKGAVTAILAVVACVYVTFALNPKRRNSYTIADLCVVVTTIASLNVMNFGENEILASVLLPTVAFACIAFLHLIATLALRSSLPEVVRPTHKFHFSLRREKPATAKTAEELDNAVKKAVAKSEKLGSWSAKGAFKDQEREVNIQWERAVSQRSVIECLTSERFGAKGITSATFLSTVDKTIERIKENCIAAGRYSAGFVNDAADRAAVNNARRDINEIIRENNDLLDLLDRLVARFRQDEIGAMRQKNSGVREEIEHAIKNMDFYAA